MGREREVCKDRTCKVCGEEFVYITAKELQEHAILCRRAKAVGIVLPSGNQLITDPYHA